MNKSTRGLTLDDRTNFHITCVMPKRVDPLLQRRQIANATRAVIGRSGLDGAGMRAVAEAAEVTTGAVTHWFAGKDAVLEAALEAIMARLLVKAAPQGLSSGTNLAQAAAEVLPLDEESRNEWRVWLAFWGRAASDARLQERHRAWYAQIVAHLIQQFQAARPGVSVDDAEVLADAVIAAVDGVGVRATLEPHLWPPERQRRTLAVLLSHLDT